MLSILNERVFFNDGNAVPLDLKCVVGASNEIPEEGDHLEAFMDRKYVHNLKSILVTRVRKITDNYVFSFLENSQLERQLLQDILQ